MKDRLPENLFDHTFDERVISPITDYKPSSRIRKNRTVSLANPLVSEATHRQLDSLRPVETEVEVREEGDEEKLQ